ncbi:MAG: NAD-dependent succinate-semialdehyde dehydrogenase [Deinococcales bacterium]
MQTTAPTQALFSGAWQSASATFPIINPFDASTVANIADCGELEAKEALESAVTAFSSYRNSTGFERSAIMQKWAQLIRAHAEELATTMSLEMGKPLLESRGESAYSATAIEWYAAEAERIAGEIVPSRFAHKRAFSRPEPVGVVYAVTPWNFPAAMIARKVAPALAAGCVVILKPAEQSPLTALLLAKLWLEAGAPKDTFQVLPCQNPVPVSKVLMSDPRVRKITFTGSTEVGKLLYAQAASTLKRMSLELGGHAPFIVFEDADVAAAALTVSNSKFRNAGQQCVASNRVYVHQALSDSFEDAFAEQARAFKLGNPLEPDTTIGPLVDASTLEKVKAHVQDAVQKGAKVVTGGGAIGGLFFEPTILSGVTPAMQILCEETFGPVAPLVPFVSEADAVAWANNTEYGLAAYIWTKDLGRAYRVAESLEYGIVGVNDGVPSAMAPQAPFGGSKYSGIGREGGRWGLEAFLELKYISIALP